MAKPTDGQIVLLIIGGFAMIWLLLPFGGWWKLARSYSSDRSAYGRAFRYDSGKIGSTRYTNVLHVYVCAAGIYLYPMLVFRIGHALLFLPWDHIDVIEEVEQDGVKMTRFRMRDEPEVKLKLRSATFEARPPSDELWHVTKTRK